MSGATFWKTESLACARTIAFGVFEKATKQRGGGVLELYFMTVIYQTKEYAQSVHPPNVL